MYSRRDQKLSSRQQRQGIAVNAFAKSVGVTAAAVHYRIKNGSIAEAVFDDGSLDEEKARVLWFANANPSFMRSRPKDAPPLPPGSKAAAAAAEKRGEYQIKTETAEVDLAIKKLKLAVDRGMYVPKEEARRALRAVTRTTRDMFLNFSARHGAEMAGELGVDPGTFIGLLEAHIRKALNEAADQPMPDFGEDDDGGEASE